MTTDDQNGNDDDIAGCDQSAAEGFALLDQLENDDLL